MSLPKARRNSLGILFAINFPEENLSKQVSDKFIKPFEDMISLQKETDYCVVMLDDYNVVKWKTNVIENDKDKVIRLLKLTRCKVIIFGTCILGGEQEDLKCKLTLGAGIAPIELDEKRSALLSNDITNVFMPIRDIEIMKCSETKDFEKISTQLKYAFLYVLASTALLCGKFKEARERFLKLNKELSFEKRNIPAINDIKAVVVSRLQASCLFVAASIYSKFVDSYDFSYLDDFKAIMESSKEYIYDTVDYMNALSLCRAC